MVKVNMMCGKRDWSKEGWISIDKAKFPHIKSNDIHLDSQFSNSVDIIYNSHGIAYFNRTHFKSLLLSWYRVLRPGGVLRLATPDFSILSKFYGVGLELDKLLGPLYGEMEIDHNGDKIWHKTVYDEPSLTKLLEEAGYVNVRRYDHTKTEHPNTGNREDYFDDHSAAYINGTLISLNMECEKPFEIAKQIPERTFTESIITMRGRV